MRRTHLAACAAIFAMLVAAPGAVANPPDVGLGRRQPAEHPLAGEREDVHGRATSRPREEVGVHDRRRRVGDAGGRRRHACTSRTGPATSTPSTARPASAVEDERSPPRPESRGTRPRATPAVRGNTLIIGTQGPFGGGGACSPSTRTPATCCGARTLDTHPAAIITQSATVDGNRVYVGTSSLEETLARSSRATPAARSGAG